MVYSLLRFWVGGGLRVWFRKIYALGNQNIPDNSPLIFACTHPNSAVDYTFLPLITRLRSFVMVRGDVFENKWLDKFFRAIWMIPVYRMRDGFSTLNKNTDSFEECYREFDKNGRTLIFSEGTSIQEKKLQPLKKGTARLALDYLESGKNKEIFVVPMANNYSRFRQFRGTVMTNFGDPIRVSDYRALYVENRAKAYAKLTDDLHEALTKVFIGHETYSDDSWAERALNVLRFNRLDNRRTWIIEDETPFKEEKELSDRFNAFGDTFLSEEWKKTYIELGVNEDLEGVLKRSKRKDFHWMLIFSLSFFIGMANIIHFLPYQLSHWIARTKIKDILFENTVMTIGSSVFYLIQFILVLLVLMPLFGWTGFVITCSMLAASAIYSELIDDYRFAVKCSGKLKDYDKYQWLYQELKAAIARK